MSTMKGERYEQVHSALIYVDAEKADVRYINFNGRLQRHERVAYHSDSARVMVAKIGASILSEMKPTITPIAMEIASVASSVR